MAVAIFKRRATVIIGSTDVSDLRVRFQVVRSLQRSANTASISVYNLSKSRIGEFRQAGRTRVILQAGYDDPVGTFQVFQGETRRADVKREGADLVLTFEAGDGDRGLQTARVNRSFKPGTSVRDIVQAVVDGSGVGLGNVGAVLDATDKVNGTGLTVSGPVDDTLARLLRSRGFEHSVQDGNLQVLRRGQPLQDEALLISEATGMRGSPSEGADGTLSVRQSLIPGLFPGRVIRVSAELVSGDYRIERASYVGDTRGGDWHADLEARAFR